MEGTQDHHAMIQELDNADLTESIAHGFGKITTRAENLSFWWINTEDTTNLGTLFSKSKTEKKQDCFL